MSGSTRWNNAWSHDCTPTAALLRENSLSVMVTLCCLLTPGQGGRDQPAVDPRERPSGTFLRKCGSGFSHPCPGCRFRLPLWLSLWLLLLFLLGQREWSRAQWGAQHPQCRAANSDHQHPPARGASDRGWEERAAAEKADGEFRDCSFFLLHIVLLLLLLLSFLCSCCVRKIKEVAKVFTFCAEERGSVLQ